MKPRRLVNRADLIAGRILTALVVAACVAWLVIHT